jgi:hypothetical protein
LQVTPAENAPWVSDLDPYTELEGCPTQFHPGIEDPVQETACDCNVNGQRDSCDMEQGLSQDCNGNDSPDECDISSGISNDCDGNGTPDECQTCEDSPGSLCPSPRIVAAVSRKPNPAGPGGVCDLPTGFNGGPAGSESRQGGIETLVVTFDSPLIGIAAPGDVTVLEQVCTAACPACSPSGLTLAGVSPTSITACVNQLTMNFAGGLPNARKYRIAMGSGITTAASQYVEIRGLIGDVNGDGGVNATDRSVVVGTWTGPGFSCTSDVNSDGQTNATDRSVVVGQWTGGSQSCAP